jgi:hypothetical protein
MYSSDGISGATPIRLPSTANLMVSSIDRTSGNSGKFTIAPGNNILSGYFTRFGLVEINLDWCMNNVSAYLKNNTFQIQVNSDAPITITLEDGEYTTAALLNAMIVAMNANYEDTFFLSDYLGLKAIDIDTDTVPTNTFKFLPGVLVGQLGLTVNTFGVQFPVACPNLVPYKYIDFVCSNLTYQQGLKDGSTSRIVRDVVYRWVFGWDNPSPVDVYGYPVFQGMGRFIARRYLAFPKQIKWDAQQSLGQLTFEVVDQSGNSLPLATEGEMEFYMTLLVSEQ